MSWSEQDSGHQNFCGSCGKPRHPGSAFCADCGATLDTPRSALPGASPVSDAGASGQPTASAPPPEAQRSEVGSSSSLAPTSGQSRAARRRGWFNIGIAVAIFVVCSIAQGMGGSSMFSTSYQNPDNPILGLLINVTFWPGWIASLGFATIGVAQLVSTAREN